MALQNPDVKRSPPENPRGDWRGRKDRCLAWMEHRPRLGWYIAGLSVLNVILNLLDLFK